MIARGPRPLLSTCKFWRIVHDLELWKARLFKLFLRPSLSDYPTRGLQRPRPRPLGTMLTMILDASACAAPLRATSSKRKLQRCCARLYYLHEAMKHVHASCTFFHWELLTTHGNPPWYVPIGDLTRAPLIGLPRKDLTRFYVALASKVPLKHVASALDREEDNEPVTQAGGPVSYQMLQIVDNVSMYEKVWIYMWFIHKSIIKSAAFRTCWRLRFAAG